MWASDGDAAGLAVGRAVGDAAGGAAGLTTLCISASRSAAGEVREAGPASRQLALTGLKLLAVPATRALQNDAARSSASGQLLGTGALAAMAALLGSVVADMVLERRPVLSEKLGAAVEPGPSPPKLGPPPSSVDWLCRSALSAVWPGVPAVGCCSMRSNEATKCLADCSALSAVAALVLPNASRLPGVVDSSLSNLRTYSAGEGSGECRARLMSRSKSRVTIGSL